MSNSRTPFERVVSVLLVDNALDTARTVEAIRASNARVTVVPDFPSAIASFRVSVPDVLVTECRLKEFNGLHLIMRLRAIDPTAVPIILTAYPDPVLEEDAKGMGAAYLTKPVAPASLLRVMTDGLIGRVATDRCDLELSHDTHALRDLTRIRLSR